MSGHLFSDPSSTSSVSPRASSDSLLIAHCDGGSRGNPGPAGYGAVIEDSQGRVVARLSEYLGKRTNNYAEYSALLGVLAWCLENKYPRLRVIADSELMVKQMQGKYKVNSPDLRPLWEEARLRAGRLEKFEIQHTLRGGNKEADQLANDAMDRGMGRNADREIDRVAAAPSASTLLARAALSAKQPASALKPNLKSPQPRQILEGFVKNGVVHLVEGELPDGIFVKVIRE